MHNWAYAYDKQTLHLRIRTKRGHIDTVQALVGDKYAWEQTKQLFAMRRFASDSLFEYWEVAIQPPFRRLRYAFQLEEGNEQVWMTERGFQTTLPDSCFEFFDFPFINSIDVFEPPAWVKDAIFYQIFPERFANGNPDNDPIGTEPWGVKPQTNNFFGGDLHGVMDKLDYLSHLGITAIYFTPLFEAPSNHKYDTQDYLKVDPHFGTNNTLKELVEECHKRGIRVLLDAVFNHAGQTFPPFADVLKRGQDSPYANWFHVREWPLRVVNEIPTYDTFAFEPTMPKLNTENPEVKAYLLKVAKYWIEEIGIDGWRLDVANEVDHHFWREFRQVVKQANPDAYLLGEIWHDSIMWLQGDQFDAVMNYPFTNAVLDFVAHGKLDGAGFANAIGAQLASYPQQVNEVAFNLLDSHDTPRLLTLCQGDIRKMKLAVLFQLTYPGTPCIYYGDEIGLSGDNDPDCRKCMIWDKQEQNVEMFDFYRTMISLRKQHPALRSMEFGFIHALNYKAVVAYERYSDTEHFVVIMNGESNAYTLTIPLKSGTWVDVFSNEPIQVLKETLTIEVSAYGFMVLKYIYPS